MCGLVFDAILEFKILKGIVFLNCLLIIQAGGIKSFSNDKSVFGLDFYFLFHHRRHYPCAKACSFDARLFFS